MRESGRAVSPRSAACRSAVDETLRRCNRTILVEIVMPAIAKLDESLGLTGEREQALAEGNRNGGVAPAMHDEQRRRDARYTLVGAEPVPDEMAHGRKWEQRRGQIGD